MNSEWQTVPIESVCVGIYDGPHATPKKTANGPVFLGISSLTRGQLNSSEFEYLSESDFAKWTKRIVPAEGDLVFSYETRLGEAALIPAGLRCCLGRRMALMRVDRAKAIPEFLLYAFLSPSFQDVIRLRTVRGSTVDRLPLIDFGSFPIAIPSLATQRDIAEMLRAIDNRTALLRETNATLEAIAQALFKSWFIDFDPVRAKQQGLVPIGMNEGTAALFPDSFEGFASGRAPKGWSFGSLADLAELNPESWSSRNHPGVLSYVDLTSVKDNEIRSVAQFAFNAAPSRARRVLRHFDTIVGTVRPGNRSFGFIVEPTYGMTASTGFAVLRAKAKESAAYIYLAATQESSIERLASLADGAAYPAVRAEMVHTIQCCIPAESVMRKFYEVALPLLVAISGNQATAKTLTTLRDTLLPRLVSGRIRLPQAESLAA